MEEDEDDGRPMVQCDKCDAWQHNECMGISLDPDDLPDKYFCEQCKPADHKELLAAIKRGEKPWEERIAQREREEEEKRNRRKKGGKKGKKGRPSDVKTEKSQDPENNEEPAAPPAPATPAAAETKTESGQKRKLPTDLTLETKAVEEPVSSATSTSARKLTFVKQPSSKVRKISTPRDPKPPPPQQRRKSSAMGGPARRDSKEVFLQTELVENVSDLQSDVRKKTASALVKLFVDQAKQAQKQGTFKVLPGQTLDTFGLRLGLAVEYAVYLNFCGHTGEPNAQYADQCRTVLFNVKANSALRDRLLSGSLSPNELSKMSSLDMASKELQEKTKEMIKETEKQHMLIREEGPRIRRTHKGEELVGDDSHNAAATESFYSNLPPRRRESIMDSSAPKQASPDPMSPRSPTRVEIPHEISYSGSAMSPTKARPLSVDTQIPRPSNGLDRKSSSSFNIQNVWSSVDTPDREKQNARHRPSGPTPHQASGLGVQSDPDIDSLLKDEDAEEYEPYSPTDNDVSSGVVWHGIVSMASIAEFAGAARHVAGANLSALYPWSVLMPSSLLIEGRIDVERASQYLCGLRWSKTTDVSVVAITPHEYQNDHEQFDKLFTYFTDRKRYGVIGKSPVNAVRDIYLVPLEAGSAKKPEFVELLENSTLEESRDERMLLITYVIKTTTENTTPSAQATPRHPESGAIASPISTQASHQQRPSMSQSGAQMSPLAPYAGGPYGSPAQQQPGFVPPPQQQQQNYHQPYNNGSPPTGIDAARQVLGDLANSASITELLAQAPGTSLVEFGIIKEVLESVPGSRGDFSMLTGLLQAKSQQRPA